MAKTVMVTGGTGYIGAWVVQMLLEKGYTVRLTVRDPLKTEKFDALVRLADTLPGNLEIFEGDLLKERSYDKAAKGSDSIIHVASPFTLRFKDPIKELIEPAVQGTRNVLGAASRSGTVKKVVLTSSVAAAIGDNIELKEKGIEVLDETQFNTSSSEKYAPYQYSKVTAEKEAWRLYEAQKDWKLVVINPSFVVGPTLDGTVSDSESLQFIKDLTSGKFATGAPDLMFGFVDVRDVARAHILALEDEKAEGRHLLAERCASIVDIASMLCDLYGDRFKLPKSRAPKFLLYLIGWMFGANPKFVHRNVGHPLRIDTRRSREKLGLTYIPLETTLREMVDQTQAT